MFSNIDKNYNIFYRIIIINLCLTIITISCEQLVFISKSTNCTITFNTKQNENSNINNSSNSVLQFDKCIRVLCLRNLIDGHCTNLQQYQFNKQKCYRQCCGNQDNFDIMKCQNFNQKRNIYENSSANRLIVILTMSLLGLMIAVIIFAVVYLKCCSKQQSKVKNNFQQQIKWKQCQFTHQKHCIKCKEQGAFIGLPCGIFYHLKCMNNNQGWKCQHCLKNIYKTKLFCPVCLKRSIIIRALNYQQLDQKIVEFYNFHPQKCYEHLSEETDTQRKFTTCTKQ